MMKKACIGTLVALASCVVSTASVHASYPSYRPDTTDLTESATGDTEVTGPERDQWIARIENDLNHSLVFEARIEQEDMQNRRSYGHVWMKRPGKMRLVYDPPASMYLVANDNKVVYRDPQLDQTTEIPVDRTPLGLLLAKHVSLVNGVTINDFRRGHGEISIVLTRTSSPEDGALTLYFKESPFALRAWTVVDAQGKRVNVFLKDIHAKKDLPNHLFKLPEDG